MTWLLRPSLLLVVSLALAVAAGVLIAWPPATDARPEPRPVRGGDREIVFLYQATSGATWERFVSAAERFARVAQVPLEKAEAFPRQTTAVPELALPLSAAKGRLVFRWYKLNSNQKVADWLDALLKRSPPPLAFIGGNTSDAAWELARALQHATETLPADQRPLLLLTAATAEWVERRADRAGSPDARDDRPGDVLMDVYPGRTFRFCFTNSQMADAVVDFLWSQEALRPDPDPVYKVNWVDDSYSKDLPMHFETALSRASAEAIGREWASAVGAAAAGTFPWHFPHADQFPSGSLVATQNIASSVGTFARPNRLEWDAASWMVQDYRQSGLNAQQRRPLLVLAGQSKPSRRFLRALEENDHTAARRYIVASGDSLAFNTVYRDRDVAWPIQDLPYNLVFFCHRNPVDVSAGFLPERRGEARSGPAPTTGTEDLLLFEDIIAALMESASGGGDAMMVSERLRTVRLAGQALFRADGNRRNGTGEHIVWLRPTFEGERVLPLATLSVWSWRDDGGTAGRWQLAAEPLEVGYEGSPRARGEGHAGD